MDPHDLQYRPPGAFSGLRLLPSDALETVALDLFRALADQLIANPPHEMQWLKKRSDDNEVRCVFHLDASCMKARPTGFF